jgi:hypothetical protein
MTDLIKQKEDIEKRVKEEVAKHVRVLKEKIYKFLSEEKPPDVLIIKSHLICEYYINQILIVKDISKAKELNKLSFFDKVNKALNIEKPNQKNIHEKLIGLNKLRNKVGHELEYILSESDVDSLGYLTGKEYVLDKYDFDKIEKLLRNTLIMIVIDVSMLLFDFVSEEKIKPTTSKNI